MQQQRTLIRPALKRITTRNITNGEFDLNIDQNDKVTEDYRFSAFSDFDDSLLDRQIPFEKTSSYLENIRTGDFTRVSHNYLLNRSEPPSVFTSDYFQAEMHQLVNEFIGLIYKFVFFFQGILGGLCILQFLILNLYTTTFSQQIIRIDQCIRIASFISTFGAFHILISSKRKYDDADAKASSSQINEHRKFYIKSAIAFIFYFAAYLFILIGHQFAVSYNIASTNYSTWNGLATVYTIFAVLGWITSVNSSKHSLEIQFK